MRKLLMVVVLMVPAAGAAWAQAEKAGGDGTAQAAVSFKEDVFPLIRKNCLPCHAEEERNPSELSLDTYEFLMKGGEKGASVVPGKSGESILVRKLQEKPPFGDRMPLNSKRKIREGRAVWLSDVDVKTIATWVDQGAKNN